MMQKIADNIRQNYEEKHQEQMELIKSMFAQKKEEGPNADAIERAAAKALVQP